MKHEIYFSCCDRFSESKYTNPECGRKSCRKGIGQTAPFTQEVVGKRLGLSKVRVSQIEREALKKVRKRLALLGIDDFALPNAISDFSYEGESHYQCRQNGYMVKKNRFISVVNELPRLEIYNR